ncbi:hypothetical protein [Nocardia farcinica]|uniref:hypothetical protein n=1 Tax=Nocardia farcinica TaxID=37329 RepID=UPI001894076A|nr:hypothetical protein [Nocardia farcinica]MBF6271298.1 hypothetical protein [Nocardia farcinica]MCZ9329404.1 hypothetical protein [Nocardia farcinica]
MAKKSPRTIQELLADIEPITVQELRVRPKVEDETGFEVKLPQDRFPVPELIRFILIELGLEDLGVGEKVAWQFPFVAGSRLGLLALRKFGLRLSVWCSKADRSDAEVWASSFVGRLVASQRSAESLLQELASQQFKQGKVTIRNQYHELRETYLYFREGARLAFAGEGRIPEKSPDGGFYILRERREGSYNILAMCTAYFSLVEHVLTLSLPFLSTWSGPAEMNVRDFIGKKWSDKYRYVFGVQGSGSANDFFTRLTEIAERHRNTYAHGAFGKEDATIYFHVPGVGAIPGNMTAVKNSPQFAFFPNDDDDFAKLCHTFDEWEQYVESSREFGIAWQWITAGLDVRYDSDFVSKVRAVVENDELENFIYKTAMEWERHVNMDF